MELQQIIINGNSYDISSGSSGSDGKVDIENASLNLYYSVPFILADSSAGGDDVLLYASKKTLRVNPSTGNVSSIGAILAGGNLGAETGNIYCGRTNNTTQRFLILQRSQNSGNGTIVRQSLSYNTVKNCDVSTEMEYNIDNIYNSTYGTCSKMVLGVNGLVQAYSGSRDTSIGSNPQFNTVLDSSNYVNYCYSKSYIDALEARIKALEGN